MHTGVGIRSPLYCDQRINWHRFNIHIGDRTTSQIIENINKTVGKLNTTKQRPLQGNGMAAISKIQRLILSGTICMVKCSVLFAPNKPERQNTIAK